TSSADACERNKACLWSRGAGSELSTTCAWVSAETRSPFTAHSGVLTDLRQGWRERARAAAGRCFSAVHQVANPRLLRVSPLDMGDVRRVGTRLRGLLPTSTWTGFSPL